MRTALDSAKRQKDSLSTKARLGQQEAREFIDALLALPLNYEVTLFGLQGDMNIRLSCERRGKVPAELDFAREIELALQMGWLKEQAEDVRCTQRYQTLYKRPIRYGRMLVRVAKSSIIKQQVKRFVGLFVGQTAAGSEAQCDFQLVVASNS